MLAKNDDLNNGGIMLNAQKSEHISKGSVLAPPSGGWSLKRLFLDGSAALGALQQENLILTFSQLLLKSLDDLKVVLTFS